MTFIRIHGTRLWKPKTIFQKNEIKYSQIRDIQIVLVIFNSFEDWHSLVAATFHMNIICL